MVCISHAGGLEHIRQSRRRLFHHLTGGSCRTRLSSREVCAGLAVGTSPGIMSTGMTENIGGVVC